MTNVLPQNIIDYILELVPRDKDMYSPTAAGVKEYVRVYDHLREKWEIGSSFPQFVFQLSQLDYRLIHHWFDSDSDDD